MLLYKVEAIILKARNLGEADKVLTLLTKSQGKLNAVAKGVRKIKSKNRGAVQPFSYSKIMLYQGKNLDTVTQCELISGFPKLRDNLDRLAYASYLAELTAAMLPEKDPQPEVFFLLLNCFQILQNLETLQAIELLARLFEVRLLNLLGYQPHLDSCVLCRRVIKGGEIYFSPSLGGLVCPECFKGELKASPIQPGTLAVWKMLAKMDLRNISRLKLNEAERAALESVLQIFLEYQLEHRIKTANFLQELKKLTNLSSSGCIK